MTKTLVNTYNIASEYRRCISNALISVCVFLIALYAFNVYRMIANTIALQKVESQSVALESKVEGLDAEYLDLSSKITPDTLSSYGFAPGKVSAYIPRNASLGRVAVGGHEL